jgi:hypothetical protein
MKYLALFILIPTAVLYPYWLFTGMFDNWYPAIGSAVAIYGGLYGTIKLWNK